jgi:hypothetical protein
VPRSIGRLLAYVFCTLVVVLIGACAMMSVYAVSGYTYSPPVQTGDGWPVSTLAAEGVDEAVVAAAMQRLHEGKYGSLRSVVLARNGKIVLESYHWLTGRDALQAIHSGRAGPRCATAIRALPAACTCVRATWRSWDNSLSRKANGTGAASCRARGSRNRQRPRPRMPTAGAASIAAISNLSVCIIASNTRLARYTASSCRTPSASICAPTPLRTTSPRCSTAYRSASVRAKS